MAVGSGQWAVFSVFPSNCNYGEWVFSIIILFIYFWILICLCCMGTMGDMGIGGYSAEAVFILAEILLLSCSNSPQLETFHSFSFFPSLLQTLIFFFFSLNQFLVILSGSVVLQLWTGLKYEYKAVNLVKGEQFSPGQIIHPFRLFLIRIIRTSDFFLLFFFPVFLGDKHGFNIILSFVGIIPFHWFFLWKEYIWGFLFIDHSVVFQVAP